MLKNLKKRRAQLLARGELAEAKAYNFFPVSFEMPKVFTARILFYNVSVCLAWADNVWFKTLGC